MPVSEIAAASPAIAATPGGTGAAPPQSGSVSASSPRFSPIWLVLAGILSVQFGAVISKGLFDEIPPVGIVCLGLMTTSLILLTFVRPRLSGRPMPDWWPVLAWASRSAP